MKLKKRSLKYPYDDDFSTLDSGLRDETHSVYK